MDTRSIGSEKRTKETGKRKKENSWFSVLLWFYVLNFCREKHFFFFVCY